MRLMKVERMSQLEAIFGGIILGYRLLSPLSLLQFAKSAIINYLIFMAIYAAFSYGVFTYRYTKAKKSLKTYYNNLKKLAYLYDRETKKQG